MDVHIKRLQEALGEAGSMIETIARCRLPFVQSWGLRVRVLLHGRQRPDLRRTLVPVVSNCGGMMLVVALLGLVRRIDALLFGRFIVVARWLDGTGQLAVWSGVVLDGRGDWANEFGLSIPSGNWPEQNPRVAQTSKQGPRRTSGLALG